MHRLCVSRTRKTLIQANRRGIPLRRQGGRREHLFTFSPHFFLYIFQAICHNRSALYRPFAGIYQVFPRRFFCLACCFLLSLYLRSTSTNRPLCLPWFVASQVVACRNSPITVVVGFQYRLVSR